MIKTKQAELDKVSNLYPDYLLLKDLPGYKAGCIFTIGPNYIYYISKYSDDTKIQREDYVEPHIHSLLRFNISQMKNPDWFKEITIETRRELKISELLK